MLLLLLLSMLLDRLRWFDCNGIEMDDRSAKYMKKEWKGLDLLVHAMRIVIDYDTTINQ